MNVILSTFLWIIACAFFTMGFEQQQWSDSSLHHSSETVLPSDPRKPSFVSRVLPGLVYCVPASLFALFCLDLSDWIVNQESTVPPGSQTSLDQQQSRIITILSFMRSQFTYFLAASASLSCCVKLRKLKENRDLLRQLFLDFSTFHPATHTTMLTVKRPIRVTYTWLILTVLASLNVFRFLHDLLSADAGNSFRRVCFLNYFPVDDFSTQCSFDFMLFTLSLTIPGNSTVLYSFYNPFNHTTCILNKRNNLSHLSNQNIEVFESTVDFQMRLCQEQCVYAKMMARTVKWLMFTRSAQPRSKMKTKLARGPF